MKQFKTLTIRASHEKLVKFLNTLKKQDNCIFTYKKQKSNEYAKNIFHKEYTVGCFSTKRNTLYKASVWVVITNEELTITNITSNDICSLGVGKYNTVLQSFYEDFLTKFLDEDLNVSITDEEFTLSDILSKKTFNALQKWEQCSNHASPLTNESDRKMWFDFIILLHNDGTKLDLNDFWQWLKEDCNWPDDLDEIISGLQIRLEYSLDLLTQYDGNNECI